MNNFEIGYYDALLENYDKLNKKKKNKLKEFIKRNKESLIAGGVILGSAATIAAGEHKKVREKNYKTGYDLLAPKLKQKIVDWDQKDIEKIGKLYNKKQDTDYKARHIFNKYHI